MAIFSGSTGQLSSRFISGQTTGEPFVEIIAPTTAKPAIIEIALTFNTPSAITHTIFIGRSATPGTPAGTMILSPEDPLDGLAQTKPAIAWSAFPATPAQFFRRQEIVQATNTGCLFVWPRGLEVEASRSIVIGSILVAAAMTAQIDLVIEE